VGPRAARRPDAAWTISNIHPYNKWYGAHWRLISLVELALAPNHPKAVSELQSVLGWLTGNRHREGIRTINGLTRRCASQEGNALAVACRLGLAEDERVSLLARSLVEWQWPDGGWNCDDREDAHHASFHESLAPLWGLIEYAKATDDARAARAAKKASRLFLRKRMFRSETTGEVIHPEWTKLHYPPYWHYDILQGLLILSRMEKLGDRRTRAALDLLEARRLPDDRWRAGSYWWNNPGKTKYNVDVVDWGRGGPNRMITLNALRVLKAAGRLD